MVETVSTTALMDTKTSNMEKHIERSPGRLGNYQNGPAYPPGQTPARFDLDAAWQRLLQLPLGLLGILAISLLLLAISLPQTTNATIPGPAVTATPTVTPSPTVTPESADLNAPAVAEHDTSSSFSSLNVRPAGDYFVAGRAERPTAPLLALSAAQTTSIGHH